VRSPSHPTIIKYIRIEVLSMQNYTYLARVNVKRMVHISHCEVGIRIGIGTPLGSQNGKPFPLFQKINICKGARRQYLPFDNYAVSDRKVGDLGRVHYLRIPAI
jgi:hypothetical protein